MSSGETVTVGELIKRLSKKLDFTFEYENKALADEETHDISVLKELLPNLEFTSLDQGLDESIIWYKELFKNEGFSTSI